MPVCEETPNGPSRDALASGRGLVGPRRGGGDDGGAPKQEEARGATRHCRAAPLGTGLGNQASTPSFLQQPLRYSAATRGKVLGELTLEEDSAERASLGLVASGALTSASGSSERRDFPSK